MVDREAPVEIPFKNVKDLPPPPMTQTELGRSLFKNPLSTRRRRNSVDCYVSNVLR